MHPLSENWKQKEKKRVTANGSVTWLVGVGRGGKKLS
jgi:hypothetical protein